MAGQLGQYPIRRQRPCPDVQGWGGAIGGASLRGAEPSPLAEGAPYPISPIWLADGHVARLDRRRRGHHTERSIGIAPLTAKHATREKQMKGNRLTLTASVAAGLLLAGCNADQQGSNASAAN